MSKPKLKFRGLKECSLVEWPGRMAAIACTPECNLRCPYHRNPDLTGNPSELPTIGGASQAKRYWIQQFDLKDTLDKSFRELDHYPLDLLEGICDGIRSEFNKCEIGGV